MDRYKGASQNNAYSEALEDLSWYLLFSHQCAKKLFPEHTWISFEAAEYLYEINIRMVKSYINLTYKFLDH